MTHPAPPAPPVLLLSSCPSRHPENRAQCTIKGPHDGSHQAFWRDRLWEW